MFFIALNKINTAKIIDNIGSNNEKSVKDITIAPINTISQPNTSSNI